MVNNRDVNTIKQTQKILVLILYSILFITFPYHDQNTFDRALKLSNQKLNILFIIIIFITDKVDNQNTATNDCMQSEMEIIQQKAKQSKFNKQSSRTSIIQEINSVNERNSSITNNINIEQQFVLDLIQEGVIIAKADIIDETDDITFKIDYQNQLSKTMFQKSNEDLLNLFSVMPSEILQDQSPILVRNSILSSQSFAQRQFKKMKRSSKFNPAQYFAQDLKNQDLNQHNQSATPSSKSLVNTVLKSLMYLYKTRRYCFEINGRAEALIIEATFQKENEETRQIEFILTIRSENTIIMISRDVVHRKNIKTLLQINQSKSKTLSYVSHEFRSPLNVIINILESIKSQLQVDSETEQKISVIIENAYYMLNLSNDLLDLAQIKGDCFRLRNEDFEIYDLAKECLKMFQLQAKQKNINLVVIANTKQLYLHCDRNRLKQILLNLIANSLKFTTQGQVAIKIQQKNLFVDIGVSDTGIGINEEDQKCLFKAFGKVRKNEYERLNQQGVGLGLLISNKIAQQLTPDNSGLKIISKYTDDKDSGSFFYLTLAIKMFHSKIASIKPPNVSVNLEIPENEPEFEPSPQLYSFYKQDAAVSFNGFSWNQDFKQEIICNHMLLVDDNIFNLNILELHIQQLTTCDIDKSNNGKEAIEQVKKKKCSKNCLGYQAIFMDLEMPQINGLQASATILRENPNIKIFIVSGYEDKVMIQEGQQLGVKEFIVKPISKEKLQKIFLEYQL